MRYLITGNEICKPLGYVLQGEPHSILLGTMYNERAEDCCRAAFPFLLGMNS
jgi:hypothetical protein